jgi:hypothetical protein
LPFATGNLEVEYKDLLLRLSILVHGLRVCKPSKGTELW